MHRQFKRVREALTVPKFMNRVAQAKANVRALLGKVPEGTGSYHTVCPKGAGAGPRTHSFAEQKSVGSREWTRKLSRECVKRALALECKNEMAFQNLNHINPKTRRDAALIHRRVVISKKTV